MLVDTDFLPVNSSNWFTQNEIDSPFQISPTTNVVTPNVPVGNILVEHINPNEYFDVAKFIGERIINFIKSIYPKQGRPSNIIKGYIYAIFSAIFLPNVLTEIIPSQKNTAETFGINSRTVSRYIELIKKAGTTDNIISNLIPLSYKAQRQKILTD